VNFAKDYSAQPRFKVIEDFLSHAKKINNPVNEQADSLAAMLSGNHVLISGGPGTGKSHLIANFITHLGATLQEPTRVLILAPTGKAAARFAHLAWTSNILLETQTIHRALGFGRGCYPRFHGGIPLAADICIVDEISMVDLGLFAALIDALPHHAQLILAGDLNQLPAVEGVPIDEALNYLRREALLTDARLTKTFRFSPQEARTYAEIAAHGLDGISESETIKIRRASVTEALTRIDTYAHDLFLGKSTEKYGQLFEAANRCIVLTTLKEGLLGSRELNRRIARIRKDDQVKPIIATRNDYTHEIFNGDIGLQIADEIVFKINGTYQNLKQSTLSGVEPAYALTIHKAQGSEFDNVLVAYNEKGAHRSSPSLLPGDHRLIYTAVTRARKSVEILIT